MTFTQAINHILLSYEWNHIEKAYLRFHQLRYQLLLRHIVWLHNAKPIMRILDVGPSFQTLLIHALFPTINVDTLGYMFEPFNIHSQDTSTHFTLDLNECFFRERLPTFLPHKSSYDLITCCEVIEHLYTPPEATLHFLKTLLKPGGHLIIQTPNAAFIGSRIKLALGHNPYMRLRADRHNPGHFREYTKRELEEIVLACGLDVVSLTGHNYFAHKGIKKYLLSALFWLPPTLKNGFTLICKVPDIDKTTLIANSSAYESGSIK